MTLKDLAVDHPYYCSTSNYYSNDANQGFKTMTEFLDEFEDADIDMNLMFRFDVHEADGRYSAECFLMLQRKGIFMPCTIESFTENELPRFIAYANLHKQRLLENWLPL